MKSWMAGSLGALCLVACGATGSMDGTVSGESLAVADGLFSTKLAAGLEGGLIVLTDQSDACLALESRALLKGYRGLVIILMEMDGDSVVTPTAGEFNIISGNGMPSDRFASAAFVQRREASCASEIDEKASSGKITVTTYNAAKGVKGSYELNFSNGDKVSGEFDVTLCETTTTPENFCR